MKEAMPIAQQDAATNLSVAQGNQQAENKAREFVASAKNQREIDNAKLATEVELNNVKNALQAAVAN
ncbi:hypothetical protein M3M33_17035, partial [Loigolactobacillus coryniformis]|uniref:hypothetical protein n=1 Tax=Loigolactobacillus coryniformis TaxID=1610 RepID=UPI00201AD865